MHINIDKYAYCNKLISIHPIEKFLYSIATLICCLAFNSIAMSILILLVNSLILVYKAKIKLSFYLKILLIPFYFLIVGTVAIAFNILSPETKAIFSINILNLHIGITQYTFIQAQTLFFKAIACVSCLYFLVFTTPMIDIISALRKLKLPELFLELMSLIYRLIFILLETADRIYNSQHSRLGYSNIQNSFKSMGYLISNLFIIAFNRANNLFTALESRGYTGSLNVLENEYNFSCKNILYIIVYQVILISTYVITKQQRIL